MARYAFVYALKSGVRTEGTEGTENTEKRLKKARGTDFQSACLSEKALGTPGNANFKVGLFQRLNRFRPVGTENTEEKLARDKALPE